LGSVHKLMGWVGLGEENGPTSISEVDATSTTLSDRLVATYLPKVGGT